jgi:hypothetical protein
LNRFDKCTQISVTGEQHEVIDPISPRHRRLTRPDVSFYFSSSFTVVSGLAPICRFVRLFEHGEMKEAAN